MISKMISIDIPFHLITLCSCALVDSLPRRFAVCLFLFLFIFYHRCVNKVDHYCRRLAGCVLNAISLYCNSEV